MVRTALQRGVQASPNSDERIKYAEAHQHLFPHMTEERE